MNSSLEALWAVYYGDVVDPNHFNGGVVVFETSRIFGGDSNFYYTGEYHASGGKIDAKIKVTHYNGHDVTAFGIQVSGSLPIQFEGRRDGDKIIGKVWPTDLPDKRLRTVLVHFEDLPNPQ